MNLIFYASEKDREQELAKNFCTGARFHGWDAEVRDLCASPEIEPGTTAVCMVGVKSTRLFRLTREAGAVPVMLDKGYIRTRRADSRVWEYWRVSVGSHHPTRHLMDHKRPADRLESMAVELQPWRRRGYSVVIAGSSAKYHSFYDLEDPTTYAAELVERLAKLTDKPLIYRPKPSWKEAVPVNGAEFSTGSEGITTALQGAWALITHGSNACFEAAIMGVPSIVLGDGIAAPISSTTLEDIVEPKLGKREQWLANLAYHQWTEGEMRNGRAFDSIRGQILDQAKHDAR